MHAHVYESSSGLGLLSTNGIPCAYEKSMGI